MINGYIITVKAKSCFKIYFIMVQQSKATFNKERTLLLLLFYGSIIKMPFIQYFKSFFQLYST